MLFNNTLQISENNEFAGYFILFIGLIWLSMVIVTKVLQKKEYSFDVKLYQITLTDFDTQNFFKKISVKIKHVRHFSNVGIIVCILLIAYGVGLYLYNLILFFIGSTEFGESYSIFYLGTNSGPGVIYFLIALAITILIPEIFRGIVIASENIPVKKRIKIGIPSMITHFINPYDLDFEKAKLSTQLRIICSGPFSLILFASILGIILLTNPFFAMILPEPVLSIFYDLPEGVLILSIMENSDAGRAGLLTNDIITSINGIQILSPGDFPTLKPGDTTNVSVLRDGQPLDFLVEVIASPDDPERGLIGIMRDNTIGYKPVLDIIGWNDIPNVSIFLLWLLLVSFSMGVLRMLPLPFLEGGKFIRSLFMSKLSKNTTEIFMRVTYGLMIFMFVLIYMLTLMDEYGMMFNFS